MKGYVLIHPNLGRELTDEECCRQPDPKQEAYHVRMAKLHRNKRGKSFASNHKRHGRSH